jgi:hypothetical protein
MLAGNTNKGGYSSARFYEKNEKDSVLLTHYEG